MKKNLNDDERASVSPEFDKANKNLAIGIFIIYPCLFAILSVLFSLVMPTEWRWLFGFAGGGPSGFVAYAGLSCGGGFVMGLLVATWIIVRH